MWRQKHATREGVVNAGSGPIRAGRMLPHEWLSQHINSKEMYPLYRVRRQFCARLPDILRHAQVLINVDNQSRVGAFKRGKAKDRKTRAIDSTVRFAGRLRHLVDGEVDPDDFQRSRRCLIATIARGDIGTPTPFRLCGTSWTCLTSILWHPQRPRNASLRVPIHCRFSHSMIARAPREWTC